MGRYRKKPVEVVARQWDGTFDQACQLVSWIINQGGEASAANTGAPHPTRPASERYADHGARDWTTVRKDAPPLIAIHTREGVMRADPGYWIIRGVQGEFYPCKPGIFEATYEVVCEDDEHEEVHPL